MSTGCQLIGVFNLIKQMLQVETSPPGFDTGPLTLHECANSQINSSALYFSSLFPRTLMTWRLASRVNSASGIFSLIPLKSGLYLSTTLFIRSGGKALFRRHISSLTIRCPSTVPVVKALTGNHYESRSYNTFQVLFGQLRQLAG
ncbi:hypothetical protein U1Q18_003007 [Sarracenia purpurea var. burkii]